MWVNLSRDIKCEFIAFKDVVYLDAKQCSYMLNDNRKPINLLDVLINCVCVLILIGELLDFKEKKHNPILVNILMLIR